MKKVLLFAAALLTAGTMMAQTIVPTSVEKRNVIIEEFTGHNCGWCPSGHQICNEIAEQYEGHAWGINIHTGGYASGSGYTTAMGDAIGNLWNVSSFPSGTVNRTTLQGRGEWAAKAASIRNEDSPVNLAMVAHLNEATRTFTIHLEVYYTSASTANLLNIAVLQNNVLGHQSNYNGANAEYIEGDQYRHMHMFRTLLTGQWGVTIPCEQGAFLDTTITYVAPANISGLAIDNVNDLEFIAFITEPNHKNIISGTKAIVITETPALSSMKVEHNDCSLDYQPYVVVNNTTESGFTSFTFSYNGGFYTVDKTIPSFESDTIHLPVYTINVTGENVQHCAVTKTASLASCTRDDDEVFTITDGGSVSATFAKFDIYTVAGPFRAKVGYDYYGSECEMQFLKQSNCQELHHIGPFRDITNPPVNQIQNVSQIPDARFVYVEFSPAEPGLYILRLLDGYGDGWTFTNDNNVAGLWVSNEAGEFITFTEGYTNGESFSVKDFYLNVTNAGDGTYVGIDDVEASISVSAYPNPASEEVYVSSESNIRSYMMVDAMGRQVMVGQNVNAQTLKLDVSGLAQGVYFVTVTTENGVATQRLSVVK